MKYVFISDIHSNYSALSAVEEMVNEVVQQEIVQYCFLGDIIGYGPLNQGIRCIDWLQRKKSQNELYWAPGNHDEWLASEIIRVISQISNTALFPLISIDLLLMRSENQETRDWFFAAVSQVETLQVDFLQQVAARGFVLKLEQCDIVGVHGRLSSCEQYIYPWKDSIDACNMDLNRIRGCDNPVVGKSLLLATGHSHYPALARVSANRATLMPILYGQSIDLGEGDYWFNPGSVGQPRDGDQRASFVIYDDYNHALTFYRCPYDYYGVITDYQMEMRLGSMNFPLDWEEVAEIQRRIYRTMKNDQFSEVKDGIPYGEERRIFELWESVYEELIHRIQTADGREQLKRYQDVYRREEAGLFVK